MYENQISYKIIGISLKLHSDLGPGLLESAYEEAFAYDLNETGFDVQRQLPMPMVYKDIKMDVGYWIDLLINQKVIIELKAIEKLAPVHFAQTLTYLKLADLKLALLINFNTRHLKDSIHRIVNNL